MTPGQKTRVLSPLEAVALNIALSGTALSDENLAGFFDENVRPDPHLLAEMEIQVAASSDAIDLEIPPHEQQDTNLQRGIQASLGLDLGPNPLWVPPLSTPTDRLVRRLSAPASQKAAAVAAAATITAAAPPPAVAVPQPATAAAVLANHVAATNADAGIRAQIHAPAPQHPPPQAPPQVHATADGNAPRTYVVQAVFPQTTGVNRLTLTFHADADQIATWEADPTTLVAYRAGGATDRVATVQEGAELIKGVLNLPVGTVRMGAAHPANSQLAPPNLFGINGVPADLGAALILQRVLCTSDLTLFISTLNPAFDGVMGSIEGLAFHNTPAGAQGVATAVVDRLSRTQAFIQLVLSHRDALPAHWSIQQVLNAVLGSITIVPIELDSGRGGVRVAWHVFMMVTTHNITFYNSIRAAFAGIEFITTWNNTGHVRADMGCRICLSIDHPTGLCPFPLVPGWMGPTPTLAPHR
ncbi:hypothetical protein B0H14DRAFT_3549280 [Mycena olivaceomarginata]|nr:hypothetical protein B0H14DRAFT_3549280 [Mycena olivaceomarginata]